MTIGNERMLDWLRKLYANLASALLHDPAIKTIASFKVMRHFETFV